VARGQVRGCRDLAPSGLAVNAAGFTKAQGCHVVLSALIAHWRSFSGRTNTRHDVIAALRDLPHVTDLMSKILGRRIIIRPSRLSPKAARRAL
jgi:hypothetical protein